MKENANTYSPNQEGRQVGLQKHNQNFMTVWRNQYTKASTSIKKVWIRKTIRKDSMDVYSSTEDTTADRKVN